MAAAGNYDSDSSTKETDTNSLSTSPRASLTADWTSAAVFTPSGHCDPLAALGQLEIVACFLRGIDALGVDIENTMSSPWVDAWTLLLDRVSGSTTGLSSDSPIPAILTAILVAGGWTASF